MQMINHVDDFFQHRSTVTLSSARNRRSCTRSSAARLCTDRRLVAPSASTARTSTSWTTASARSTARSTRLAKFCRATRRAKRVCAQGWLTVPSFYHLRHSFMLSQARQRARQVLLHKQRLWRIGFQRARLHQPVRRPERLLLHVNRVR